MEIRGVEPIGAAAATTGTTNGGRFISASSSGRGVYALASATSGTNYGIYAQTNFSSGYAGYFQGRVRDPHRYRFTGTGKTVGIYFADSGGTASWAGAPGSPYFSAFSGRPSPLRARRPK